LHLNVAAFFLSLTWDELNLHTLEANACLALVNEVLIKIHCCNNSSGSSWSTIFEVFAPSNCHLATAWRTAYFKTVVTAVLFNDLQHYSEFLADSRYFFPGYVKTCCLNSLARSLTLWWQYWFKLFLPFANTLKIRLQECRLCLHHIKLCNLPFTTCFSNAQVAAQTLERSLCGLKSIIIAQTIARFLIQALLLKFSSFTTRLSRQLHTIKLL